LQVMENSWELLFPHGQSNKQTNQLTNQPNIIIIIPCLLLTRSTSEIAMTPIVMEFFKVFFGLDLFGLCCKLIDERV
jgi:hypothetical protein